MCCEVNAPSGIGIPALFKQALLPSIVLPLLLRSVGGRCFKRKKSQMVQQDNRIHQGCNVDARVTERQL